MKLFKDISSELEAYEARREKIIKASRDILRASKRIIFMCHEGALAEAGTSLQQLSKQLTSLEYDFQKPLSKIKKPFMLYGEGSWNACVEEYLEAWFLYNFIDHGKLVAPRDVTPPADVVVGALSDFTGELVRLAVMRGAKRDSVSIETYRRAAAEVVAALLPLYLTGQPRQKFDQAKKNLKRMEEILYEVTLRT